LPIILQSDIMILSIGNVTETVTENVSDNARFGNGSVDSYNNEVCSERKEVFL